MPKRQTQLKLTSSERETIERYFEDYTQPHCLQTSFVGEFCLWIQDLLDDAYEMGWEDATPNDDDNDEN